MYGNELNAAGQPLYFPWERAKDRRRQREALAKREAEKLFTKEETRLYTIYFFVWVVLTFIVGLTYHGVYHIVQPYTNYDLMKPHVNDGEPSLAMFVYEVIAALCVYCFHAHSKSWIDAYHSAVKRRNERRLAAAEAAAEAAAAELLADEPASRDDARAGRRRRAPRGRRRERARGATPSAKEPAPAVAVPESKPEAPAAPESKSEAPPAAPEAKGEEEEEPAAPAVPRGYENVARALAHLDEARLLPLFEAQQIDDAALPTLEPSTLVELGVPPMVCLALSGAATSGKAKKLEADDLLDGVAKHQSVLEEALREHRAELARLKISSASELPEDLCCPITTELMSEPVMCVGDGNTYERAAIEQWFATGARTSPTTNAQLESITLVPNLTVKRLIAVELERRGRTV